MAIEARNRPLPDWFTRIRTHQTVLARFQRFEAWGHAIVTQLFNTILHDLPVGAALVLEVGDEEPFISRTIKGAPTNGERVTEHLLDGQQRLTALWRGLHNNYDDRTYFLFFKPDDETGMPYYVDSVDKAYVSLNCALVTWRTNRNISDKEPERYLAERRDGSNLGNDEVKARLSSHLIPYDEMVAGDYKAFLDTRAYLMHTAMTKLCTTGGSRGRNGWKTQKKAD